MGRAQEQHVSCQKQGQAQFTKDAFTGKEGFGAVWSWGRLLRDRSSAQQSWLIEL